jgi:multiple sugar transport system permease protein
MMRRVSIILNKIILYILVISLTIVFTFPIYWLIMSSFKIGMVAWRIPPQWFAFPNLTNYRKIFELRPLGRYYLNSLIVVFFTVSIALTIGIPAAYSLARLQIKRKKDLLVWILSQLMLPPVAVALPIYMLVTKLGLMHSLTAVIICHIAFNLPFAIWLLREYFMNLPIEIEEAAMMEGCKTITVLKRIVIPLSGPGVAATAIFCTILSWNEYLYASILTGPETFTLPVTVASFWTQRLIIWGPMFAAGVLAILPVVIMGLFIQKYLIKGLTLGAIQ